MKKQNAEKANSIKVSENYQRYFVPVIGKPLAKDLITAAHLHKGEKILDVACGTGVVTRLAAEQVGPTGKVEGLDVNLGMLEVAKTVAGPADSIQWHEADAATMPLSDNSFDAVICQMGLQFVDNKPAVLKEMHRVMAPEGRLVMNLPGPISPVFKAMDKALEKHISPEAGKFVEVIFSLHAPEEIRNLLVRAGFHDIKIEQSVKPLRLPAPKDFLWQYISSTPLAGIVGQAGEKKCNALEKEVVSEWQRFVDNGNIQFEQPMTMITAKK